MRIDLRYWSKIPSTDLRSKRKWVKQKNIPGGYGISLSSTSSLSDMEIVARWGETEVVDEWTRND